MVERLLEFISLEVQLAGSDAKSDLPKTGIAFGDFSYLKIETL
jgi:hypothetical protein